MLCITQRELVHPIPVRSAHIRVELCRASLGVLRGDVDGSYAGAAGALDLDTEAVHANYFTLLLATHKELSPAQFGIYHP